MGTRKSMKLPVIITFILIIVIVYLFVNIKQSQVTCFKNSVFIDDVLLNEEVTATIDNKKISSLIITKTIILPDKYVNKEKYLNNFKDSLDNTLSYLGDKVKYSINDDRLIVKIEVNKKEIVLLDNIDFVLTSDLKIVVDSNTKSSNVVTLTVGDNYTDGEFMKRMKNSGYSCK